jgi:phasin family protein
MTTAAKTPKTVKEAAQSLEAFTAAGQNQVRENIDRSMAAMAEAGAFGKENVEALVASATVAAKGFETLSSRAVAYTKSALENHVAATKSIMTSKSVQEAMEKQAEYARSAFDTYLSEMNSVAELWAGVAKDAVKPLNERASAVSHLIQNNVAR